MSLGKFTPSVVSATQETTVALAALNFDFSLFKTEAPKEYKALGHALSPYRREVAEDGDIHTTARKLRALFEHILPQTPRLYTAYGVRASEIANGSLKTSKAASSGPFAAHQGVDGGSIWAAATSGAGAVAIHLLACMLAKLWLPSEATSIWEEIVGTRKEQLSAVNANDPQNMFAAWAARLNISRQQLADWDASARAWLRAGDDANRVRQRQLKLIVENVNIPINTKPNVYESVVAAWTSAMVVLDKLIEGMPHTIENSAILLALSSWHLFPDMSVLGTSNQFIRQNDALIDPRGILTLGLQSAQSEHALRHQGDEEIISNGITWSLPLCYSRFYGHPVRKEKSLNTDGSRISIDQLLLFALGCLFHGWQETSFSLHKAAELTRHLWRCCVIEDNHPGIAGCHQPSQKSWLGRLAHGAETYLASDGVTQKEYTRLFNHGRRRCPQFLSISLSTPSPITTLQHPPNLLRMMKESEGRLDLLRRKASRFDGDLHSLIIYYATPSSSDTLNEFAIATVSPTESGASEATRFQCRWLTDSKACAELKIQGRRVDSESEVYEALDRSVILGPKQTVQKGDRLFWCDAPTRYIDKVVTNTVDKIFGDFAETTLFGRTSQSSKPRVVTGVPFEFIFGDPTTAAVYRIVEEERPTTQAFDAQDIVFAIAEASKGISIGIPMGISQSALIQHLCQVPATRPTTLSLPQHIQSLKTLCTITNLYEHWSDVTLPMTLTSTKLHAVKWMPETELSTPTDTHTTEQNDVPDQTVSGISSYPGFVIVQAFEPLDLDLAHTFACIAMLEFGLIDISEKGLESVMALSAGDSLYIATPLISDPACISDQKITRIRGNLGRAGIALMIPPDEPLTREADPKDWNFVDHNDFDGVIADFFKTTSLHLSFTGLVLPVDTTSRGSPDTEVYFLETLISAHDKGQWLGDLNILPIFSSVLFHNISKVQLTCQHARGNPLRSESSYP
ncbi:uncharacterized protein KY384_004810 [Bacidia gigantensis]|uniref:uncharacterized protein n=1 Tax=Bacidia gigantensis TaxID=2732470 RepID=UPI001D0548F2|nr:uncharacterized protein KY384_004810 [Bacidia gigantensis]KAG8530308.1 hypothetical protein KY384_004810 [Bacidia gigantensis]